MMEESKTGRREDGERERLGEWETARRGDWKAGRVEMRRLEDV